MFMNILSSQHLPIRVTIFRVEKRTAQKIQFRT